MLLGIEIGGTKLQLVTGNTAGQIDQRFRFVVDRQAGAGGILDQIDQVLQQLPEPPQAIGVGFGGPVDTSTGIVAQSHQIDGWAGFELGQWLRKRTKASTVWVDNDANVAALGEARLGAGQTFRHVFYVTLGSGVGGGMVTNGELYRGAAPGEAEIGHLRLSRTGDTLESCCSGWAVDQRIREQLPSAPAGSVLTALIASADPDLAKQPTRFLASALRQNDPFAEAILREVTDNLAFGLSHVVHLFHPDVLVLGGGLSLIGEPLRAGVETRLPHYLMAAFRPGPVIRLAEFGEDAVPVGALCLTHKR